jgi:hypothetical protein
MQARPDRTPRNPFTLLLSVTLLMLLTSCGGFEAPDAEPPVPVEYPVEHYLITDHPEDFVAWKAEVRALRTTLREEYPFEDKRPELDGVSREAEFLEKAVDPGSIIWRDPSAFWREPINLSWWELIDEAGAIRKVFVITSNQSPREDARIIAWCIEGKVWTPAVIDGRPSPSIRSASINLGESKWHVGFWHKKLSSESAIVITVLLIAVLVRGVWWIVDRRRDRRATD